ncbi:MAG: PIN domain-containing protein [Defluviitaleaceae bacterium]|nr:PIN domain-containing protein [Defluviitaleaceae bacterium]
MKILLDTNVILDFFLSREPGYSNARHIFTMVYQDTVEAFTTASSITDMYYITAKKLGDEAARKAIRQLLKIMGIIAVEGEDCLNALDFPIPDYEDALVSICANKEDIKYIVTNDKVFLQTDPHGERIINAYDFVSNFGH